MSDRPISSSGDFLGAQQQQPARGEQVAGAATPAASAAAAVQTGAVPGTDSQDITRTEHCSRDSFSLTFSRISQTDESISPVGQYRMKQHLCAILHCQICCELPRNVKIFSCRNGHLICQTCMTRTKNISRGLEVPPRCSVCYALLYKVYRNIVAEKVISACSD